MDLEIEVKDKKILYIRVAALISTSNGLLFEKSPRGYIYLLGGKISFGETSEEAVVREIREEIGMEVKEVSFQGTLENFFSIENKDVHEICFFYLVKDVFTGIVPDNMIEVNIKDLNKYEILPKFVKDFLSNAGAKEFVHLTIKQNNYQN